MKKFISAKMINLADARIGSKIIFKTVPSPAIIIGNFISPSPAKIDLKNPEKTMKGSTKTI